MYVRDSTDLLSFPLVLLSVLSIFLYRRNVDDPREKSSLESKEWIRICIFIWISGSLKPDRYRKTIKRLYMTFGDKDCNLRLGLCTNGMNPFSNLSSQYNTWLAMLVIYNLPTWSCMKRKYIILSLLISGSKQHVNQSKYILFGQKNSETKEINIILSTPLWILPISILDTLLFLPCLSKYFLYTYPLNFYVII